MLLRARTMATVAAVMFVLSATAATTALAQTRAQVRIVGSSTLFPFATAVAERFGQSGGFPTPVVEATGTGGGLNLFCRGIGVRTPDIVNASRRIKASELALCMANGVTPVEVKVGFDGIVVASAATSQPFDLTREQIFLALVRRLPVAGELGANPNRLWSDIDPALPEIAIEVLGPPPTSGTREAFVEQVMIAACPADMQERDCSELREDGVYIDAGENDNLIVQKLTANPRALGIFGFSFLDQNSDKLIGHRVDGIAPTFDNIADGAYPISRSLFFYLKSEHVGAIDGLGEYVAAFTDDRAWGDDGYLTEKGLVPLVAADREKFRADATALVPVSLKP
ncbi:MAG: phosphate ABC transporter substrate-binding protein [Alphaproteobacteria bacterium]|nr:phosphate ABC transporter substrate-binding protein [Alphaproteobacteria bacterium]